MSNIENGNQSPSHKPAPQKASLLIIAILAGILIAIIGMMILVFVTRTSNNAAPDSQSAAAIAERIRPVADNGYTFHDANPPKQLLSGKAIYSATCFTCHDSGIAGAPKLGDTSAWATRISQGYETLVTHATQGFNAMPAKGGRADLSNEEIARAVAYMANAAGATFTPPEQPVSTSP